jgi:outer membrane protein assembly factor BamB
VVYRDVPNESWIDSYDPQTGSLRWRAHFPDAALVGGLVVCRDLLCAPVFVDGIYILDLRSGSQKAHLLTGTDGTEPKVGCTRTRVLVVNGGDKWTADLAAFDTTSFRTAWRRSFPRSYIWQVASTKEAFQLLQSGPFGPGPSQPPRPYEMVVLSAEDGHVITRKPAAPPDTYGAIPKNLPAAVRRWLTRLLRRKGGVLLPRTNVERSGDIWFVGNFEDKTAPGTVFAVRSSGRVVWQRAVPDLEAIVLYRRKVIAGSYGVERQKRCLTAFDADTGKPLWAARLE